MKIEGVIYRYIQPDKCIVAKKVYPSRLILLKEIKAKKVKDGSSDQ